MDSLDKARKIANAELEMMIQRGESATQLSDMLPGPGGKVRSKDACKRNLQAAQVLATCALAEAIQQVTNAVSEFHNCTDGARIRLNIEVPNGLNLATYSPFLVDVTGGR